MIYQQQQIQQPNTFNGIVVHPDWSTPELTVLEKPQNLLTNSALRTWYPGGIPDEEALTATTIKLLAKMNASSGDNGCYITFKTSNPQHQWGMDFKIAIDNHTRTKRAYVEASNLRTASTYGIGNDIQDILNNNNIPFNSNSTNNSDKVIDGYALCFAAITSVTNYNASKSAQVYVDAVYHAMVYIESLLAQPNKFIVFDTSINRYVMSTTLYELLIDSNISVGGIKIKPVFSVSPTNVLQLSFVLDFREDITVKFKGDLDYNNIMNIMVKK